ARPDEWCGAWVYADLPLLFCGSELARDGGLTADQFLADVLSTCGSWFACDGGLPAGLIFLTVLNSKCGSEPACDDGLSVKTVAAISATVTARTCTNQRAFIVPTSISDPSDIEAKKLRCCTQCPVSRMFETAP
ncbi:hypothetical protein, partial [Pseudomonas fluorescens]|uniref:hypothetical protein n=1 Tax=Pseudomonas fluorescens TaxID=294 RepID=UPI001C83FFF0